MIAIVILTIILSLILYYFCTRTFNYWRCKNVNGPKPVPFFGNIQESVLRKKTIGLIYKEIYDQYPEEKVVGFYRMTSPTLLVKDLDVVRNILVKDFEVFSDRGILFSKDGLGDNLFHCDNKVWRVLRDKFTPAFTSAKLKNAFNLISERSDKLVDHLESICNENNEQELHQYFRKYTMSTIMAVNFGLDVNLFEENNGFIEKAGYHIFKTSYTAETDMLLPNIWKKINLSLYHHVVNKFCNEVVQAVLKQRNGKGSYSNDIMDIMLAMNNEGKVNLTKKTESEKEMSIIFSEATIAGQVFILFAAGFGNNALSLSYTLFQLAKNPDCQEKLIKEIDETLEKYDGKLTYEALKEMNYVDKVFSEILRMNPLTAALPRSTKQDYKIPGTDIVIDKGTTVIISPYAIHRDEKLYPDPDKFDPERFSPENCKNRHPCAFLPFGAGPRSCLGKQLGKLQYLVALVKFFTRFRVEPSEKTKQIENYDPMCSLIATKGGIYVNIVPRKFDY